MGFCVGKLKKPKFDNESERRNAQIEEQLKLDKQASDREVKMLLLGAGESGKSTILKQMKLIHEGGYTEREKRTFRSTINSNILQAMQTILGVMPRLGVELGDPALVPSRDMVLALPDQRGPEPFDENVAGALKGLWGDPGVRAAYARNGAEYHLNDSAKYYLDSLDRITCSDYDPSDQDILRSRVKTTGVVETTFQVKRLTYRMFDVGGQRSERKKWLHLFENVHAIVFLVALSEYDQMLAEDEGVNRMQEALMLFESICNSRYFVKTSIILFLNKIDLFRDKIEEVPIDDYFEDYEGGASFENGCDYFQDRFVSLISNENKQIYTHMTCATDTGQIEFVMTSVYDIILQANLKRVGLI